MLDRGGGTAPFPCLRGGGSLSAIAVDNLTRCFGEFTAVDGVQFSIQEGEIFGYLGPNGAGKTTTLNMLTGLARPTQGSIAYYGQDYTKEVHKARPFIGIVPDESNLYGEMTGFENLAFCGALYGIPRKKREERAEELLKQFGLQEVGSRAFGKYSKGMKRRLTIAAALVHEPSILFLDEPTTGIDVGSARQVRNMIGELNANGTTILLTTHYIEEAQRLCHRLAFIVEGKIVALGSREELMAAVQDDILIAMDIQPRPDHVPEELKQNFSQVKDAYYSQDCLWLLIPEIMNLMPFMEYFIQNEVALYGARVVEPSLEDVFVRMTGLEAKEMKQGQGGK